MYIPRTYEEKRLDGSTVVVDLYPESEDFMNDDNKKEFVLKVCEERMIKSIEPQLERFTKGFRRIFPKHLLNLFKPQDIQLMISGIPNIDVEELISKGEFENCSEGDHRKWIEEILREFSQESLSLFLRFVTGNRVY